MNASGELLRTVRLELPPETHRALRIQAAKEDCSMAALCRRLVEEYLAKLPHSEPAKRPSKRAGGPG